MRKIWGENWLCLSPYLKAFPVFNVLETCREYFLTIDLGIVEFIKKFIERFLEKCEILRHTHTGGEREHPTTVFCKIFVQRRNYCLTFSIA